MLYEVITTFYTLLFSLTGKINQESKNYPFYSGEVHIASSILKNDSTKLVSDASGDPLFFSRDVFTEACETGVCYPIRITLFWDYAGGFLGFSVRDDYPLTKAGHNRITSYNVCYTKLLR